MLDLPLRRLFTSVPVRTSPASTFSSRSYSKRARRLRATVTKDSSSDFALPPLALFPPASFFAMTATVRCFVGWVESSKTHLLSVNHSQYVSTTSTKDGGSSKTRPTLRDHKTTRRIVERPVLSLNSAAPARGA